MAKLTTRERVICGAALASFITAFLPWSAYTIGVTTINVDGWSAGLTGVVAVLLLTIAGVYLLLRRNEYAIYAPPFGDTGVVAGLAAGGLLLVIVDWATLSHTYRSYGTLAGTRYGIWLALAAGVVEAATAVAELRARAATN